MKSKYKFSRTLLHGQFYYQMVNTFLPLIIYENPNEEFTEGLVLLEKGEYKCMICNNILAQYRKFNKSI